MASLTALVLIMTLTVAPVLIPLVITAAHAIADWRRKPEAVRPVTNSERQPVAAA